MRPDPMDTWSEELFIMYVGLPSLAGYMMTVISGDVLVGTLCAAFTVLYSAVLRAISAFKRRKRLRTWHIYVHGDLGKGL